MSPDRQLTVETFASFRDHFIKYQQQYTDNAHFGTALESFAPIADKTTRILALRSLFSFHRSRAAMWIYVMSLLRVMEDLELLKHVVYALSFLAGHGDITWNSKNEMDPAARLTGRAFITLTFGRKELIQLLRVVDEDGFARGTIGQAVHAIIDVVR